MILSELLSGARQLPWQVPERLTTAIKAANAPASFRIIGYGGYCRLPAVPDRPGVSPSDWWLPMIEQVAESQPTVDQVAALLADLIPGDHGLRIAEVRPPNRLVCTAGPGGLEYALSGSVSGPTIFKLVDYAAFLALNACVGSMRSAVLAQSSISFLEPAQPGPLRIAVDIVQLGMRTAVTDVRVTDGRDWLVAMASLHFSLPGRRTRHAAGPAATAAQPGSPIGRTA